LIELNALDADAVAIQIDDDELRRVDPPSSLLEELKHLQFC
jgi:hypothetical protein